MPEEKPLTTQPLSLPVEPAVLSAETAWRSINTIRVLAMDAVEAAQSGHPGTPMALAPAAYILWTRHLRHHPGEPDWPDRDRFVLSCGHASMLLYSLLYLSRYGLTLDDLRAFRQWGSPTAGHPERGHTRGIETTTGPLGQGVGNAVGMAIAERLLADRFNRPDHEIVDHRTWAFVSDGDMMEGVGSEVASLAGHLRLGKLTLIYDDNHITIDGDTALAFSEDVARRYEAYGWVVHRVADGNDLQALDRAFSAAAAQADRPSLVIVRTVIAYPAPTKQNTPEAHGAPLGADEVRRTKEILGWPPDEQFHVPQEALADLGQCVERGAAWLAEWAGRFEAYGAANRELAGEFRDTLAGRLPEGWDIDLPSFAAGKGLATRAASKSVLEVLVRRIPALAGGSADLAGSTGVDVSHGGTFGPTEVGQSLHWGVREHAMGTCLNGMAAHGGIRPYGSSFLIFSDYMKPAIRLAAIMRLPVIYVFTHDSVGLGEDGPTHQPIEQLATLRATPGMVVIRPADAAETREAWRVALERGDGPTALVLTRQKVPTLDRSGEGLGDAAGLRRGGYVLYEAAGRQDGKAARRQEGPEAILIATGSEVSVALDAARLLETEGHTARVVSLPSWELFEAQPRSYQDEVLPPSIRARVAVEAASPMGWDRWVTDEGESVTIDRFGASAPGERILQEFGFTADNVARVVRGVVERARRASKGEKGEKGEEKR